MRASNSSMAELLEGKKVFAVPLFQRQYSWDRDQWRALWKNIEEQYEFELDEQVSGASPVNHFIGSFVLSPITTGGPPTRILVVDGQQRLITISILLAVLRDLRWERTKDSQVRRWLEDDFTKSYLMNSVLNPNPDNMFRVLPTQKDREDFASTVSNTPASPSGRVGEAYRYFYGEVRGNDSRNQSYDLERLTNVMLSRLTLIEVRTEKGDNVHRVFQTLNSSGVRLKQIDLLRNHFFMLLPTLGQQLYLEVWRDMELRLGESAMDSYFWASLVPYDRRVSRRTVFSTMQERLERDAIEHDERKVEALLRELNENSIQYLSMIDPSEESRPPIRERLEALKSWGTDTYYPLGLALLIASRQGMISDSELSDCFLRIESFLVRRMLVGVPTNNLNRIFSTLTGSMPKSGIGPWLRAALSNVGRPWPDDGTVVASILARPFLFSGQPGQRIFVVRRIEDWMRSRGRVPLTDERTQIDLQRLMPSDVSPTWPPAEGELYDWDTNEPYPIESVRATREKTAHTLGNTILIAKGSSFSGDSFQQVRERLADTRFLFNQAVLSSAGWDPDQVQSRSFDLAEIIRQVWPGPDEPATIVDADVQMNERAVLLLPDYGYTLVSDLAELWAVDESQIRQALNAWPPDVAQRVVSETIADSLSSTSKLTRRYKASDLSKLLEVEESADLEQPDE